MVDTFCSYLFRVSDLLYLGTPTQESRAFSVVITPTNVFSSNRHCILFAPRDPISITQWDTNTTKLCFISSTCLMPIILCKSCTSPCYCWKWTIYVAVHDMWSSLSRLLRLSDREVWQYCRWASGVMPGIGDACQSGKMAIVSTLLFFVFKISLLPNYRVEYYDFILKWCSRRAYNM